MPGRIDWQYALGLALDDPGFHYSVLCAFRNRLLGGGLEQVLLEELLVACRTHGLLRLRGRQRTDSTHVFGALRLLNRLEQVAETMRAALDAVAVAAPEWLRAHTSAEWFERYGRRVEEYRLPQTRAAREAFARQVGEDGMRLLTDVFSPEAPPTLRTLPAVEILRRTWVQRYFVWEGEIRLREPKDQPPAAEQIVSPYDDEARYDTKRDLSWVGYRVHLTETCDDDRPPLVTDVGTTVAPASDVDQLEPIQARLATRDLLPTEHIVDTGYIRTGNLVTSQQVQQIDLIGPMYENRTWQAKEPAAFDLAQFQIDWEAQVVTCPNGQRSTGWVPWQATAHRMQIHVQFAPAACRACPVRARCTRAQTGPRHLTLYPRPEHDPLPVRTYTPWEDQRPGFFEIDLVAHCGTTTEGFYLNTLTPTDVANGWTECIGVWGKSQRAVFAGLQTTRQRLPMALLGLDSDNGSEFLNAHLVRYCTQEQLTFTRSRPYWKNDQAHVEQKNWSVVRKLIGYGRYESEAALVQLNRVYELLRIWTNFWQPSLKLVAKERDDTTGKTKKRYDTAQTPYRRLLASGVLDECQQQALAETFAAHRPLALRRQVATAVEQLSRLQERSNERFALENEENEPRKVGW